MGHYCIGGNTYLEKQRSHLSIPSQNILEKIMISIGFQVFYMEAKDVTLLSIRFELNGDQRAKMCWID